MRLSGWGRYPVLDARVLTPRSAEELEHLVISEPSLIARGNGRSYGDSAINPSATIDMRKLNRMLSFDPDTGEVVAEAGVLLGEMISVFLPRGWFPRVTPGTKFVTLGGAIAADVHGKNHHGEGGFRSCVAWVDVMGPDGAIRRCSPRENPELFDATLGGMGLTGVILRAAIRLQPVETAWIRQTTRCASGLASIMAAFEEAQAATYSVAWIDCLATGHRRGRSLLMTGEHATRAELPAESAAAPYRIRRRRSRTLPLDLPDVALNGHAICLFNSYYYWRGARKTGEALVDYDQYFFPLDGVQHWNRAYGRRGFLQFQCVLPLESAEAGLSALLAAVGEAGLGSPLAVLKRLGPQSGAFSFPMAGYTLALDFPMRRRTHRLLEQLDAITIAHGGRFYLAKDSRMRPETLRASDPRIEAFMTYRDAIGASNKFRSAQSERLAL